MVLARRCPRRVVLDGYWTWDKVWKGESKLSLGFAFALVLIRALRPPCAANCQRKNDERSNEHARKAGSTRPFWIHERRRSSESR